MRKYPDDFNISTYPAGKPIAVSRAVCVAIMTVFLLIVFACAAVLLVQRSVHNHPFLISINDITGQWSVVGHNHNGIKEMSATRTLQESVLGKYIKRRFYLPGAAIWQNCERKQDCNPEQIVISDNNAIATNRVDACALYCITGDTEYEEFMKTVIPEYLVWLEMGDSWTVDMSSIQMLPISGLSENGGVWQIKFTLTSIMSNVPVNILAYASIGRNMESYPQTLGYYIEDFNAYKISK